MNAMGTSIKNNEIQYVNNIWTNNVQFDGKTNPVVLIEKYGSPLYVYNENVLRKQCKAFKNIVSYPKIKILYSSKANTNLALLKIIHEEGLFVDSMSPGEIF